MKHHDNPNIAPVLGPVKAFSAMIIKLSWQKRAFSKECEKSVT